MTLITPGKVRQYFSEVSGDVIASDDPAGAFEARLRDMADTVRLNALGKNFVVDRLQQIAEAAGLVRERGDDWVTERIARVFPQANSARVNGASATSRPLNFIDPAQWQGQEIPPRRWLVPYRIPLGNVTMLNGDGAAGKTTIALQLGAATPRGTDWLGSVIDAPGPALFMTAEEDCDEIHRRLGAIVEHQGIGFGDLTGLRLLCLPDADAVLGTPDRNGVIRSTPLFESLAAAAAGIRPVLIVIEAAADVFAGNENDRAQVRQFIALLRRLALGTGAAVLLIAHPSLTGMSVVRDFETGGGVNQERSLAHHG